MRRVVSGVAWLAAVSCGSAAAPSPRPDPVAAEVEAELRRMYADLSSREWARFESHFAEGAVVVFRTREGRSEVLSVAEFVARDRKALEGRPIFEER